MPKVDWSKIALLCIKKFLKIILMICYEYFQLANKRLNILLYIYNHRVYGISMRSSSLIYQNQMIELKCTLFYLTKDTIKYQKTLNLQ